MEPLGEEPLQEVAQARQVALRVLLLQPQAHPLAGVRQHQEDRAAQGVAVEVDERQVELQPVYQELLPPVHVEPLEQE